MIIGADHVKLSMIPKWTFIPNTPQINAAADNASFAASELMFIAMASELRKWRLKSSNIDTFLINKRAFADIWLCWRSKERNKRSTSRSLRCETFVSREKSSSSLVVDSELLLVSSLDHSLDDDELLLLDDDELLLLDDDDDVDDDDDELLLLEDDE